MAVRIRMKKMGRTHRPFYRICAMDGRAPRDGKVLEELGTYDTSLRDVNARAILKKERIDYWVSVGAQPSDKVKVLIKKYGTDGTHLDQQQAAIETLAQPKSIPDPGKPTFVMKPAEEAKTEEAPAAEAATTEETPTTTEPQEQATAEATETSEAASTEETSTEEAPAADNAAEESTSEEAVATEEAAPADETDKETKE